jgi:ParB family chromosome partitioning protein
LSDNEALAVGLVENLQREDLSAIDETEAILQLLALRLLLSVEEVISLLYRMQDELKGKVPLNVLGNEKGQTVQNVFDELGKLTWESFVSSRLPLLKLPSEILSQVRTGTINYTKAVAIAKVKQEAERKALLDEALASQLTLSQIRERVRTLQQNDAKVAGLEQEQSLHHFLSGSPWKAEQLRQQRLKLMRASSRGKRNYLNNR